jgi:hypothetical protein
MGDEQQQGAATGDGRSREGRAKRVAAGAGRGWR